MTYHLEDISTLWRADVQQYGIKVDMWAEKYEQLFPMHGSRADVADALVKLAEQIMGA